MTRAGESSPPRGQAGLQEKSLGTPFRLDRFDTPASKSSLELSTPAASTRPSSSVNSFRARSVDDLRKLTQNLKISPASNAGMSGLPPGGPTMPPVGAFMAGQWPLTAAERMQKAMQAKDTPPARSNKQFMTGLQSAFAASMKLQRVMAFPDIRTAPVPFVRPPAMPDDMWEAFNEGLKAYGVDDDATESASLEDEDEAYGGLFGEYEEEKPQRTYENLDTGEETETDEEMAEELKSIPPIRISASYPYTKKTAEAREPHPYAYTEKTLKPPKTHASAYSEETLKTREAQPTSVGGGKKLPEKEGIGWSPPVPFYVHGGRESREQAGETAKPNWARRTADVLRQPSQLFDRRVCNSRPDIPEIKITAPAEPATTSKSGAAQSRGIGPIGSSFSLPGTDSFFSTLFRGPSAVTLPDLALRPGAATSATTSGSRKRPNCEDEDISESEMPSGKKEQEETPISIGLPAASIHNPAAWQKPFPGNTPGLIQTLIAWHSTMRTLYSHVDEDYLMSIHPMFPYRPTEPMHVPLVSVSFWDTGSDVHKELWRIGPGDVHALNYNTVDTFRRRLEMTSDLIMPAPKSRNLLKRKEARNIGMRDRALTGEGTWCFFIIRGHRPTNDDPKEPVEDPFTPYLTLAFPISAITETTESLHILFPDSSSPPPPSEPVNRAPEKRQKLSRFASMPIMNRSLHRSGSLTPAPSNLRNTSSVELSTPEPAADGLPAPPPRKRSKVPKPAPLTMPKRTSLLQAIARSRSDAPVSPNPATAPTSPSTDDLPGPTPYAQYTEKKENAPWPVRRTILWFKKGGHVPLIEGYGTDVAAWRPFLEAVGRGEGKIMLVTETEMHIKH